MRGPTAPLDGNISRRPGCNHNPSNPPSALGKYHGDASLVDASFHRPRAPFSQIPLITPVSRPLLFLAHSTFVAHALTSIIYRKAQDKEFRVATPRQPCTRWSPPSQSSSSVSLPQPWPSPQQENPTCSQQKTRVSPTLLREALKSMSVCWLMYRSCKHSISWQGWYHTDRRWLLGYRWGRAGCSPRVHGLGCGCASICPAIGSIHPIVLLPLLGWVLLWRVKQSNKCINDFLSYRFRLFSINHTLFYRASAKGLVQ